MDAIPDTAKFFSMYLADSKVYLLNHFKALSQAAKICQLNASLDCHDFSVNLHLTDKTFKLYPQFLEIQNNEPIYSQKYSEKAVCFIGWRPYTPKVIQNFINKLQLKHLLQVNGFLVPQYSFDANWQCENVIVKREQSSFGKGMFGPFHFPSDYCLNRNSKEYYEKFIFGTIAKIAFWNERPLYLELQSMPTLQGNGQHSILELAQKRARQRGRELDERVFNDVVSYQNKSLDEVLAKGEIILADFRYESDLAKRYSVKEIILPNQNYQRYYLEMLKIGKYVYSLISNEGIQNFYYSVDAIVDATDNIWILEANSNPTIHQSAYLPMLQALIQDI